jgi:serine/threonine-protein kinase
MTIATVSEFVDAVGQCHLLEPEQLAELTGDIQSRFAEPRQLAKELMQRGWLTPYQVNHLLQGRHGDLVLGPYLLLERLGDGVASQVFKARHQRVGRVVALKVVAKERLANPEAVRRFHQEMQATAKLAHPNAIFAYDADQIGDAYCIAMEYVEGADLARLVKQRGPLPVAVACDYIRQAALGLQHAHEQGLVHRNIKPSNLLLAGAHPPPNRPTAHGIVKVLDLGLARLQWPMGDEGGRTVLPEGMVMGTPDYIAPEQAVNAGKADARADLYGLGCSLYFLLTGQPPFPGGSLAERLIKHQYEEPVAVEQLRPEVTQAVAAILRKLMAKRPDDRYQTAAAAAEALAATQDKASAIPGQDRTNVELSPPQDTAESDTPFFATPSQVPRSRKAAGQGRWLWIAVAGVAGMGLATVLAIRFLGPGSGKDGSLSEDTGRRKSDSTAPPAPLFADDFNGAALSSAWRHEPWPQEGGGAETLSISKGILALAGAQVRSNRAYSHVTVNARLRFGEAQHQHFGLATGFDPQADHCWALFSTAGTTDTLFARINVHGTTEDASIGPLPSGYHEYGIKPVKDGFQFSVDGAAKKTLAANMPGSTKLHIVFSAYQGAPMPPLQIDWVRIPAQDVDRNKGR